MLCPSSEFRFAEPRRYKPHGTVNPDKKAHEKTPRETGAFFRGLFCRDSQCREVCNAAAPRTETPMKGKASRNVWKSRSWSMKMVQLVTALAVMASAGMVGSK